MEQPQLQPQDPDARPPSSDVEGMTEMSEPRPVPNIFDPIYNNIYEGLREHLLAAQAAGQVQSHHDQYRTDGSTSPHGHLGGDLGPSPYGAVDVGMGAHMMPLDVDHKGKRELSTSKRAAQNRAAQRAFRQRKEGYIKKLEDQVRNFNALQESYKSVQSENYQLRDYVLSLQSRLIEAQGEFPQPPPSIDLQNPRPPLVDDLSELQEHLAGATNPSHSGAAPTAPMGSSAASQLARAAVQAGEYVAADLERRQNEDETRAFLVSSGSEAQGSPRPDMIDKVDATSEL